MDMLPLRLALLKLRLFSKKFNWDLHFLLEITGMKNPTVFPHFILRHQAKSGMIPIIITLTTVITNKNRTAKNLSHILALASHGLLFDNLACSPLIMSPLAIPHFDSANFSLSTTGFSFTSGATSGTISEFYFRCNSLGDIFIEKFLFPSLTCNCCHETNDSLEPSWERALWRLDEIVSR